MRIAIVGSRDYPDLDAVREYVRDLPDGTEIVSGGARGVDRTAEQAAMERGLTAHVFFANWQKYGKSAGMRRNHTIVENADQVVAFWDGKSRGTQHTMMLAEAAGKLAAVVTPDNVLVITHTEVPYDTDEG